MKKTAAIVLALGTLGAIESQVSGAADQAFGFNASLISGFPRGRALEVTGGGAVDLEGRVIEITFPATRGPCRACARCEAFADVAEW